MTHIKLLVLLIGIFSLSNCVGQEKIADGKGFAVLELFTSEGCSSCPPADELLAKIQKETAGKEVYVLAYHVDYWDRQGWKDAFSKAEYSERQSQYATWMSTPQIYTPQLVINGRHEFVGADESAIRHAISEQLAVGKSTTLTLTAHQEGKKLKIQYEVVNASKESGLQIVVVQKEAQSKVTRGENAGRFLSHVQVVTTLHVASLNTNNTTITLPNGFDTKNWEVLGFIQNQYNGTITAAAKAALNN
jgi:hypothetical protein